MEHPGASSQGHKPGCISPHRVRTMKEYDQEIAELTKDNFNLKLQLYFLEEKMEKMVGSDNVELFKMNVQLGVDLEILRKELEQKEAALEAARTAAPPPSANLQQLVSENQVLNQKLEVQQSKSEQLEQKLAQAQQDIASLTQSLQEVTEETCHLRAELEDAQQEMESQQKTCSELEMVLEERDQELADSLAAQEEQGKKLEEALKKVTKRNKIIQGLSQQIHSSSNSGTLASFVTSTPAELLEQLTKLCGGSQEEVGKKLGLLTEALGSSSLAAKTKSSLDLEQECKNLHIALTEKERFVQELLDERNRIRQENEKSLKGYFLTLQQKQDYIQELESKVHASKEGRRRSSGADQDLLELLKKEGLQPHGKNLLSDNHNVSVIMKLLHQKESLNGGEKVLAALLEESQDLLSSPVLKAAQEKISALEADHARMAKEMLGKDEQHASALSQMEREHAGLVGQLERMVQEKEELIQQLSSARMDIDEDPPLIDIGDPGESPVVQGQLKKKRDEVDQLLLRQWELKQEMVQAERTHQEQVGHLTSLLQATQEEIKELRRTFKEQQELDKGESDQLKEDVKVLVTHLEEQEGLLQELAAAGHVGPASSADVDELRKQLALSKHCSQVLQDRLEELADFLEALMESPELLEISSSLSISRLRRCLNESRQLSQSLSRQLHASETSSIFGLDQTAAAAADETSLFSRNKDAGDAVFTLGEQRRKTIAGITLKDKELFSGTDPGKMRCKERGRKGGRGGHIVHQEPRLVVLEQAGSDSESLVLVLDDRGQPQDVQMVRMVHPAAPPIPEQQAALSSESESDLWSEPDRAVSLQRLGLSPAAMMATHHDSRRDSLSGFLRSNLQTQLRNLEDFYSRCQDLLTRLTAHSTEAKDGDVQVTDFYKEQARLKTLELEEALNEKIVKEKDLSAQLEAAQQDCQHLQLAVQTLTKEHKETQDRCKQVQDWNLRLQRELSDKESYYCQAEEDREALVEELTEKLQEAERDREQIQEELRAQVQQLQEMAAQMGSADKLMDDLRKRAKEGEERGLRSEQQLVELEVGYRRLQEEYCAKERAVLDAETRIRSLERDNYILQEQQPPKSFISLDDSREEDLSQTNRKLEKKLAHANHQLEAIRYLKKFLELEVQVYQQLQETSISLHPTAATASTLSNPLLSEVLAEMQHLRREYSKSIQLNKKLWNKLEEACQQQQQSPPPSDGMSDSVSGSSSASGERLPPSPEMDRFPTRGTPAKKMVSLEPAYSSPDLGIESDTAPPPAPLAGSGGGGGLWAVSRLHHYELLKRELTESRSLVCQLESRLRSKLCCGSPAEMSALREAQHTCSALSTCLKQGQQLVAGFWMTPELSHLAPQDTLQSSSYKDFPKSPSSESELSAMRLELESLRKQLQESNEKLNMERSKKASREQAISKQLLKTRKILKQAKGNLQEFSN